MTTQPHFKEMTTQVLKEAPDHYHIVETEGISHVTDPPSWQISEHSFRSKDSSQGKLDLYPANLCWFTGKDRPVCWPLGYCSNK